MPGHMSDKNGTNGTGLSLLGRAFLEAAGLSDEMIRRAYQRLNEGMFALETKQVFQRPPLGVGDGKVISGPPMIAWTERRLAAEAVLRYADHQPNRMEHEVHGQVSFNLLGLDDSRV